MIMFVSSVFPAHVGNVFSAQTEFHSLKSLKQSDSDG